MFKGWLAKIALRVSVDFEAAGPGKNNSLIPLLVATSQSRGTSSLSGAELARKREEHNPVEPPTMVPWLLLVFQRPQRSFLRPLMILSCSLCDIGNIPDGHYIYSAVQASYTDVLRSATVSCWHRFTLATCSFKSHFCLEDVNANSCS